MQLQLGKKYKTKKGDIVGPLIQSDDPTYPFECPITTETWMGNGNHNITPDDHDIIEEVLEEETSPPPREDAAKTDKVGTGLTLIPWYSILELGKIFIEGLRYGRDNWKKGVDDKPYQEERLEHAMLHLLKWKEGDRSEQHLAKVMWFCTTQLELERLENEKTTDPHGPDPTLNTNVKFSRTEMEVLLDILHTKGQRGEPSAFNWLEARYEEVCHGEETSPMTDSQWTELLKKLK